MNNQMNQQDDMKITQALADFQPTPNRRFHERMNAAPWAATEEASPNFIDRLRTVFWRPVLSTALALALVVAVVAVTPPLRAFAQELLGLFIRETDDTLTYDEQLVLEEIFDQMEMVDHYTAALRELEASVGFDVWVPGILLPYYEFDSAFYNTEGAISFLAYRIERDEVLESSEQPGFLLIQQRADQFTPTEWNTVGASAAVDVVEIGDADGEYVEGYWCQQPEEVEKTWCIDSDVRFLTWQQDGFVFVIQAYGDLDNRNSLSRREMIGTARNLMSEYVPMEERIWN